MITQELIDYVRKKLGEGVSREEIKRTLMAHDWKEAEIEEAFRALVIPEKPLIIKERSRLSSRKIIFLIAAIIGPVCVGLFLFFFLTSPLKISVSEEELAEFKFDSSQIVNVSRPAIVKIGHLFEGEIKVRDFEIDVETFEIRQLPKKELLSFSTDNFWTGSGFIVSPNGFILTAAHVADPELIKQEIMTKAVFEKLFSLFFRLAISEPDKLKQVEEKLKELQAMEEEWTIELQERNRETFFKNAVFSTEEELKVFSPRSKKTKLSEVFKEGFETKIIAINDNYLFDQKDIALIKIDFENLPVISLGDSDLIKNGQSIFTYGFPAAAQVIGIEPRLEPLETKVSSAYLEPSFVPGMITALKESGDKSFKFIETNAKVGLGSSGSPILNDFGETIGILTLMATPQSAFEVGDIFAWGIPINLIGELNGKETISEVGDYYKYFKEGLYLLGQKHCRLALEKFEWLRKNVNQNFPVDQYLDRYVNECYILIQQGKSIDTRWDKIKTFIL